MVKSTKKSSTKVDAAVVAAPAKPLKKGKRGAEDIVEKEVVSAKKQKIDEKKVEVKAEKKVVKKKVKTSSEEDSSSSEPEQLPKVKAAKNGKVESESEEESSGLDEAVAAPKKDAATVKNGNVAATKKKQESGSSSESSSEEESSSDKEVVAAKNPTKAPSKKKEESSDDSSSEEDSSSDDDTPVAKKVTKKDDSSDDSDSDSSDEDDAPKKAVVATKNGSAAATKTKDESSDESDDSSSDEDDIATKKVPATAAKKDESSEESDDESSDDDVSKATTVKKATALPDKDSDDTDDESSEESEDEEPQKKKMKVIASNKKSSSEDESSDEDEEDKEEPSKSPQKRDTDVKMTEVAIVNPKTPVTPKEHSTGSKTLFVGNLSFSVEQADVENFFKDAGQVVDVRFAVDRESNSFKGFGHVEFATAEEAEKALRELNGKELLGRAVKLDMARERKNNTPYSGEKGSQSFQKGARSQGSTIFVRGFDKNGGEDQIRSSLQEFFGSCGGITRVSIPTDPDGGVKGIAYINFSDVNGFNQALELHGSELEGSYLTIEEAKPRADSDRGSSDGQRGRRGRFGSHDGGRFGSRDGGRFGSRDSSRGGRSRGRGDRGGRTPYNKPSMAATATGKKMTFGDE